MFDLRNIVSKRRYRINQPVQIQVRALKWFTFVIMKYKWQDFNKLRLKLQK